MVNQVIRPFRAEEYFLIDIKMSLTRFRTALKEAKIIKPAPFMKEIYDEILKTLVYEGEGRYACKLD